MGKWGKSKTYVEYLKSYLIVFAVPLVLTIFGYSYSNHMVREEVLGYQTSILRRTQEIGDQVIYNHKLSKSALANDKQLKSLMRDRNWTGELMYDIVNLKDNLAGIVNSNSLMSDIHVYFPKSGDLITPKRRYSSGYTHIYAKEVGLEGGYTSIFTRNKASGYYILNPGTDKTMVFTYQNYYARNYRDIEASIVTVLKWSDIESLISEKKAADNGIIFLINEKDQVIGNEIDIKKTPFTYSFFENEGTLYNADIAGKNYICSFVSSTMSDFKYVMCVPKNEYYKKNNYLLYVIALELFLSIIIGTLLASYFAKKTSSPIEKIFLKMNQNGIDYNEERAGKTVFSKLENVMSDVLNDYQRMEDQLKEHNKALNERMLVSLLNDRRRDDKMVIEYKNELVKKMEEAWSNQGFRIIAVGFTGYEESSFNTEDEENNQDNNLNLVYFSIKNIFSEIVIGYSWGLTTESDNAVILITKDCPDLKEKIKTGIEFFKIYFKLDVYAAVSARHEDYNELPESYEEAMETANFKTFWDDAVDDIVVYESRCEGEDAPSASKYAEHIKKINNCVATKNYNGARQILEVMMDECFKKDISYMKLNQCQASGIISIVMGMFEGMENEQLESLYTKLDLPNRLLQTKSINQLRCEIDVIFDEIIQEYEEQTAFEAPKIITDIKEYIEKNYADSNLSIGAIAEKFDLTLTYIGRIFKKYTGMGILEYLHLVRVEKCKELLDEGEAVKDAAEKAGFFDSKAMIRIFRKIEGITPGQYKKRNS